MQTFEQITAILEPIKKIVNVMKQGRVNDKVIEDIQLSVNEINQTLYFWSVLKFQKEYDLDNEEEYFAYVGELESLIILWEQSIQRRTGLKIDREFWSIYEFFKYVDANVIYQLTVEKFMSLPEGMRIEYLSLPHRYTFLNNKIDFTKNDFSLIYEHTMVMVQNVENYKWLYEHLADNRSKIVLNGIIRYWFEFDLNKLHALCETVFEDYYDMDIFVGEAEDVLVDLGAYIGDSVIDYIDTYGVYKRIYAYELTPSTYQTLCNNVSTYSNVIVKQKGVSDVSGIMYVNDILNGAGNKIEEKGDTPVEIVTLDEDIEESISVIKMDIEGAEKAAINGAARHIKEDRPKLMISAYHKPEDIFEIPHLINDIRDDYQYYLRFNGHNGIWPCDYVLFAV